MGTGCIEICPYCGRTIDDDRSKDHVFSEFLGGRRTIPSCVGCNNGFGRSFEGKYSEELLRFKTWLTMSGVPQKWERDFRWRKALVYQGTRSDLVVQAGKVLIVRAEPEIVRDELGKPVRVYARTVAEAQSITRGLKRKNRVNASSEPEAGFFPVALEGFEFDIDAGPDLGKLCLKMCSALATLLPDFDSADLVHAVKNFQQEEGDLKGVVKDGRTHVGLDRSRPPLAHVIYVERTSSRTYGVVQFFGSMQFYCTLGQGSCGSDCAMLGVLDSTTGEEVFREVDPLNLSDAFSESSGEFTGSWSKKLFDQIREMGCTDFSDVQIAFKPSFRFTLFSGSTTEIWPFARILNTRGGS